MPVSTPDLCDTYGDQVQVADPLFQHFGGQRNFYGEIATVKCFEDNSKIGEALRTRGDGKVLVVDGGGSLRRSLLGDKLARLALDNGWQGIVIYGCLRDVEEIAEMPLGVYALGSIPRKTDKRGEGQRDIDLRFAGLHCRKSDFIYVDGSGMIVSREPLKLAIE